MSRSLTQLEEQIVRCNHCARLRAWCTSRSGQNKAYEDAEYWAKPVPGFGDVRAGIVIVGLAPGAHGANRTGRPFTGDFAGDILYQSLYQTGMANAPRSVTRGDGLKLRGVYITNAVRCAPPDDKPVAEEFTACAPYLAKELSLLGNATVVIALGQKAYDALKKQFRDNGGRNWGKFSHGKVVQTADHKLQVLACYHTSRRNVNRGLMDAHKLVAILHQAQALRATGLNA